MVLIAIGRFEDEQIAALGPIWVEQDGGYRSNRGRRRTYPATEKFSPKDAKKIQSPLVSKIILYSLIRKRNGVAEHGHKQGIGGMCADYLAFNPGIDQVRHPADMIDMGVGQIKIVNFVGWDRKLVKGQHRVIALGGAAVDQDIDAIGGTRPDLYQVTGTGDAVFRAEMGNFHAIWYATFSLLNRLVNTLCSIMISLGPNEI